MFCLWSHEDERTIDAISFIFYCWNINAESEGTVVSFPEGRSAGVMDLELCVWPNGETSNSNSNDSKMVINEFNKMLPNRVIVLKLMNECIN